MGRSPCCSKVGLHRGPWTGSEDSLLTTYIQNHGEGNWRSLPKQAGLLRCGKSCRLRWMNYLRPDIKRGNIGPEEEDLIIRLHRLLGNRWSLIAGRLPGRTDNEIKNYWNSHLSKKLKNQGKAFQKTTIRNKQPKPCLNDKIQSGEKEVKIYAPKATRLKARDDQSVINNGGEKEKAEWSDNCWSEEGDRQNGEFDSNQYWDLGFDQFLPLQQDSVMLERLYDEYSQLLHSEGNDMSFFAYDQVSLMV